MKVFGALSGRVCNVKEATGVLGTTSTRMVNVQGSALLDINAPLGVSLQRHILVGGMWRLAGSTHTSRTIIAPRAPQPPFKFPLDSTQPQQARAREVFVQGSNLAVRTMHASSGGQTKGLSSTRAATGSWGGRLGTSSQQALPTLKRTPSPTPMPRPSPYGLRVLLSFGLYKLFAPRSVSSSRGPCPWTHHPSSLCPPVPQQLHLCMKTGSL